MKIKNLLDLLLVLTVLFPSVCCFAAAGEDSALEDAAFIAIVGGEPVPASSRFARLTVMIMAIYEGKTVLCSGTLISKDTAISAAHCVKDEQTGAAPQRLAVVINPTAGIFGDNVIPVTKFRTNPGYRRVNDGFENRPIHDISVLHLDRAAKGPDALIAQLPTSELRGTTDVVLAGYGRTNPADGRSSGKLYFAWTSASVIRIGVGIDSDMEIRLTGIQPCGGDSGGPIFKATNTSAILLGVTSNVMDSCSQNGTAMSYGGSARRHDR